MTTKRDATVRLLGLAKQMRAAVAGDDEADLWIFSLEAIAYDLDPAAFSRYADLGVVESRRAKIRRLIEHPDTPMAEREAAVVALARLRRGEESRV